MIRKLAILVVLAVGGSTALQASTVSVACSLTSGTDPATYAAGGTNAVVSGAEFTCPAFTVPAGNALTGVEMEIDNSFSYAIPDQRNTVDFIYNISGFDAVSWLTSYSSSDTTTPSNGTASDLGYLISQSPGGSTGCVQVTIEAISCNEITPVTTSFDVTGSSQWATGGLTDGGSDGFSVTAIYTYVPTVSTPEPSSLVLFGSGLLGLGCFACRRKWMI